MMWLHDLIIRFITGILASAVVTAVWWLITGSKEPPFLIFWPGAVGLVLLAGRIHKRRVRREVQELTELYSRPAYGEGVDE